MMKKKRRSGRDDGRRGFYGSSLDIEREGARVGGLTSCRRRSTELAPSHRDF